METIGIEKSGHQDRQLKFSASLKIVLLTKWSDAISIIDIQSLLTYIIYIIFVYLKFEPHILIKWQYTFTLAIILF